jgi:hypothetical protein
MKQYSRKRFLLEHPFCTYCGDTATTTDHCPPRCFFERRRWPEAYEFPACASCNEEARLDEQALAVLARIELVDDDKEPGRSEWRELVAGVLRNQPEIMAEWRGATANQRKRYFREAFGPEGDRLRWAGFGALHLGPLTRSALQRFAVKLGKALYYRHNDQIFEGDIYVQHIDPLVKNKDPEYLRNLLQMAPGLVIPERNTVPLGDQFAYRFNCNAELGVLYAAVEFNPQLVLLIMAVSLEAARRMAEDPTAPDDEPPTKGVFHCTLKRPQRAGAIP